MRFDGGEAARVKPLSISLPTLHCYASYRTISMLLRLHHNGIFAERLLFGELPRT